MSFEGLPKGSASKQRSFLESIYLVEVVKGLVVTARHLVDNILHTDRMPTMQYPEEKRVYSDRFRGRHRLMKREDGTPRCVACQMCSTYCPADCITIVAGEHPDASIEKFPESFEIDLLRCVYCGLCEEACPCDAIRLDTGIYEIAADQREKFVVGKEFLLNDTTRGTL
ncbi:MAG TPA: NADH-quinone oxidoreductase subunit I [Candidatus Krumholzibacteria bacterium]|nr:NADH-quinone oxidoreductase subunit I [Candidatus Krumholzibacteria bacterium]